MSDDPTLRIAFSLFTAGQPLGAAIIWANALRIGASAPVIYAGLGSALLDSRGVLVRKPFEEWAAKVFARGAPALAGSEYADVVEQRRAQIPAGTPAVSLRDDEIPAMIEFLVVNESVLPDAIAALPPDDYMGVVMALGDVSDPLYIGVLRAAIAGRYGDGAGRSALKRIGPFLDRVDVQGSLAVAAESPIAEELGPYLTFVLERLPPMNTPRTAACPPYEGIGNTNVDLANAGPGCVQILRERLGASTRDARSWVQFAPCRIKRNATRADAAVLHNVLTDAGATVTLS
jgi:hypothetical protein